jgi:hypothetical protein
MYDAFHTPKRSPANSHQQLTCMRPAQFKAIPSLWANSPKSKTISAYLNARRP